MSGLLKLVLTCVPCTMVGCATPYYTSQGTVVGGLTGAGVGAAIGQQNNEAGAGAAIGSLVGAASGALLGNNVDRQVAREQAAIAANFTTMSDLLQMSAAGLSDEVIVTHILSRGFAGPLTASDLVGLKQAGLSDRVINALQQPPLTTVAPAAPVPAYIVEPVPIARAHWHGPPRSYPRPQPRRRGGPSWGFAFGW